MSMDNRLPPIIFTKTICTGFKQDSEQMSVLIRTRSLCGCAVLCTHAFLNTFHSDNITTPPKLADLETRLSPPLLWHFERRERVRVAAGEIQLSDIAKRGSPSLPARYFPRLAGDEGGSHCS